MTNLIRMTDVSYVPGDIPIGIHEIQFKKLTADAIIPCRATPMSAGFDLYAAEEITIIGGMGNFMVSTGIAIQLPPGTYGRIAMRSGLAAREHLTVSAGVIDPDYTGEVKVLVSCSKTFTRVVIKPLLLTGVVPDREQFYVEPHQYTIKKGERFAQLIVEQVSYAPGREVAEFTNPADGTHAGFGSTGST